MRYLIMFKLVTDGHIRVTADSEEKARDAVKYDDIGRLLDKYTAGPMEVQIVDCERWVKGSL